METLKAVFFGPDPKKQKQKCRSLVNSQSRSLNRDILKLKQSENSARAYIIQTSKRAQRNPSQAKQAAQDTRMIAREMIKIRKQHARLTTSKAQLESVRMQIDEAFAVEKIGNSLKTSTGIMKDINTLVKLPELTRTMRELSQELMKAGIIEEMVGDMIPSDDLVEEEAEETEIDKVLGEVLKTPKLPDTKIGIDPEPATQIDGDPEDTLQQMQGRLEALKS